jgi:hypothetical protein
MQDNELHRAFMYGLLARDPQRRKFILWQWLLNYQPPPPPSDTTVVLLRQIWYTILETLLWQPNDFVVESYKFLVLGPAFPVRYEWLTASERRHYIVGHVFAHRKRLFKSVSVMRNNTVCLTGFLPSTTTLDDVWRRQWVRDIAEWTQGEVALEFTCAIQRLAIERGDVFLSEMFATLNGHGWVSQLPCWGHGQEDNVRPWEEEEEGTVK